MIPGDHEVIMLLPGCTGTILHTKNREQRREALFRVMNLGRCWVTMQGNLGNRMIDLFER